MRRWWALTLLLGLPNFVPINLGRKIPPLFETGGKRYHGVVGRVPEEVQEMLASSS